jgi:hypothetical protein
MRLALEHGEAWVTTTGASFEDPADVWWAAAAERSRQFDEISAASGEVPAGFGRFLNLEARTSALGSLEQVREELGRAAELGFTDVVLAWPRPDGPFAGEERLLDLLADELDALHRL